MIIDLINQIWVVWCQMAPYLILGFVVAGALFVWIKPSFVERHLGSGGFSSILKTTLLGIPLPLCSCGVIPVAASLRRQGASKGATTAFLLATPQTGVDSIAVTYSLLGGFFAVFRPLAALVSGIAGGMIVSAFDRNDQNKNQRNDRQNDQRDDQMNDRLEDQRNKQKNHQTQEKLKTVAMAAPDPVAADAIIGCADGIGASSCCGGACAISEPAAGAPVSRSLLAGLRYGLVTLPSDIGQALAVGVVIAGAISAFAPPDLFQKLPGGTLVQMLFMMAVGIPLYVCATASVPVAAALIMKGISPGAALVFLITGPATNAAAISTIWKIMGRRTAIVYLAVVAVFAMLSGFAANWLLRGRTVFTGHLHDHALGLQTWEYFAGALLIVIMINACWPRRKPAKIYPVMSDVNTVSALSAAVPAGGAVPAGADANGAVAVVGVSAGAGTLADKAQPDKALYDQTIVDKTPHNRAVADRALHDRAVADRALPGGVVPDKSRHDRAVADKTPHNRAVAEGAARDSGTDALTFNVKGMRCSHCAGMIRQNLESVPGVTRVDVSLESGVVSVRGLALDCREIGKIITDLGYKF